MNANEMLDFVLGQLDGPARGQAERDVNADPQLDERVGRLTRALNLLVDDGAVFEPPPGLADRTIRFVTEARNRRKTLLDYVPVTVPFRWTDVAVAAGIFLAGLLTLVPAVQRSRESMAQAGCSENLQRLGRALWMYGDSHRHYPFGPEQHPDARAGTFAAMLHDDGLLPDASVLDCPSNGSAARPASLPRFEELCELLRTDPGRVHEMLCWDYAYNISHQNKTGRVEPIEARHSPSIPLLADKPDHEAFHGIRPGNSPNHGGRGQNVLYSDLHVGWHNTRRLNPIDDDMFLNARHELGPGLNEQDTVLSPSEIPFLGGVTR